MNLKGIALSQNSQILKSTAHVTEIKTVTTTEAWGLTGGRELLEMMEVFCIFWGVLVTFVYIFVPLQLYVSALCICDLHLKKQKCNYIQKYNDGWFEFSTENEKPRLTLCSAQLELAQGSLT